jgi:hypothetical protein
MRRRSLLLALPALAATACTSVPLSTIWKLRSFSVDDFFALNPNELRAAVRTDARASFSAVDIEIAAKPKDGVPSSHRIRLQQAIAADARLEPAPADRRWFVFALGSDGVKVFDSVRRDVAALRKNPGSSLTLGISARESVVPPDIAQALPMRLDLLLDPKQGWFTMLSETRLDTTRATRA